MNRCPFKVGDVLENISNSIFAGIYIVTEITERGFRYKGDERAFIPRWGMSFTGEGEVYCDLPWVDVNKDWKLKI